MKFSLFIHSLNSLTLDRNINRKNVNCSLPFSFKFQRRLFDFHITIKKHSSRMRTDGFCGWGAGGRVYLDTLHPGYPIPAWIPYSCLDILPLDTLPLLDIRIPWIGYPRILCPPDTLPPEGTWDQRYPTPWKGLGTRNILTTAPSPVGIITHTHVKALPSRNFVSWP